MAGALDVEVAKERFRRAAERLGDQTLGALFHKSPAVALWTMVGAAGLGLLLGRNRGLLRALVRIAAQLVSQEEETS